MSLDQVECARRTIHTVRYVTIATICAGGDGRPWNTPVFAAFDSRYAFYWISDRWSQHSRNIRDDARVFLAIYDSTIPEGTGARKGVYVQARAAELSDPGRIARAHRLIACRAGKPPRPAEHYRGAMPGRIYHAVPERVWLNDTAERDGHRVDVRVEIELAALRDEARCPRLRHRAQSADIAECRHRRAQTLQSSDIAERGHGRVNTVTEGNSRLVPEAR